MSENNNTAANQIQEKPQPYYKHPSFKGHYTAPIDRPLEKADKKEPIKNKEELKKREQEKAALKTEKMRWRQAMMVKFGADWKTRVRQSEQTIRI